jgi:Ca2+-binding EF-hand superfamily protein
VVRGTLSIFGRPDGRLSALSTAETSVCLSVNQASSIQSRGGTCESITIGHNPFKLDLSLNGIFLKRFRPLFLCERMLVETDANHEKNARQRVITEEPDESDNASNRWRKSIIGFVSRRVSGIFSGKSKRQQQRHLNLSQSIFRAVDCSVSLKIHKNRSAPALLGAYLNIDENTARKAKQLLEINEDDITVDDVVTEVIVNRKWFNRLHKLYESMDVNRDGLLSLDEFIKGTHKLNPDVTEEEAVSLFQEGDTDGS